MLKEIMAQQITMDDLHDKTKALGNDCAVVDIRTPGEFAGGHVPGSLNFPVDEIEDHVTELKKYKEVYLYCRSGARVQVAAHILEHAGLKNLYCVFSGGLPQWIAKGYEIEK